MVGAFVQVWTELLEFIISMFTSITDIFVIVSDTGAISLTFVGTCAVIMAGVALVLLAFNIIRSFLPMRG